MPGKSSGCTGALAGDLLRDRGCACEGGDGSLTVGREAACRRCCGECGEGLRRCGRELEAGCGALVALLLAPLGAELGDSHSCDGESALLSPSDERAGLRDRGCIGDGSLSGDGESALLSASDERAWLRDRGCIGDGSLTVRREAVCRRCGGRWRRLAAEVLSPWMHR